MECEADLLAARRPGRRGQGLAAPILGLEDDPFCPTALPPQRIIDRATPSAQPAYHLVGEDSDASFRLTREAGQERYRAGQEIDVLATLTYLGPADAVVARQHDGAVVKPRRHGLEGRD